MFQPTIASLTLDQKNADRAFEEHLAALRKLQAENTELLAALEAITERAEDVSQKIPVENRSEGVSQASHVRHMASHLAQHAKIARAAIEKAKGN